MLLRRAARIAGRKGGRELVALHVLREDGLAGGSADQLAHQRQLAEELGGTFHTVVGDDVARSIIEFAQAVNASHIVLGVSRRGRLAQLFSSDVGREVARAFEDIDVVLVTHPGVSGGGGQQRDRALTRRRRALGWALAVAGPPLVAVLLAATRDLHSLPTELLLLLTVTVAVALVGGLRPALVAAVSSSLLANYYFTPPLHTFTIEEPENALALLIFVVVAAAVASVVDLAARRSSEAAQAQAEAGTLGALARSVLSGRSRVSDVLDQARETFGQRAASLLVLDGTKWSVEASVGPDAPTHPDSADAAADSGSDTVLALAGRPLPAGQQRVLAAFAVQAAVVRDREHLREQARQAEQLAVGNSVRTALLAAVSHDLRTPLAGIKAAASSLAGRGRDLEPGGRAGAAGHDRGVGRAARCAGREPARHEPPADGRGEPARPRGRPGRGGARRAVGCARRPRPRGVRGRRPRGARRPGPA